MFLHVCVILFMGGGAIPACIAGGIPACLAAGLQGGVPAPGGSAPGVYSGGGVPGGEPPGRLLLREVRILLECILVYVQFNLTLDKIPKGLAINLFKTVLLKTFRATTLL